MRSKNKNIKYSAKNWSRYLNSYAEASTIPTDSCVSKFLCQLHYNTAQQEKLYSAEYGNTYKDTVRAKYY